MKDQIYLVVDRHGVVKMNKREPDLSPGQHLIRVLVKVPDSVFAPASPPVITVEVPEPKPLSGGDVEMEIRF